MPKVNLVALTAAVTILLWTTTFHAAAQLTQYSIPVSPSVWAMFQLSYGELATLVLWRGHPKWYSSGNRSENGSGSNEHIFSMSFQSGRVSAAIRVDRLKKTVAVGSKEFPLQPDANVFMVDDVDADAGPRLVAMRHLDAGDLNVDPPAGDIAPFFHSSPELMAFLRCGDAATQPAGPWMAFGACP